MGEIEVKGLVDRLTVLSILAKNGYLVRQQRMEQIVNGKKVGKSVILFSMPEDPLISIGRSDDD